MSTEASWWITLAAGLVVAVVAVVLLHLLLRQVQRIERASVEVWTTGKRVAGNTATTWMLDLMSKQLDRLGAKVSRPPGQQQGELR